MQLLALKISNLFGLYNYALDFNLQDSYLSLITGPNGYGKTTILKIINNLNVEKLYYYYTLKFDKIVFQFDDGSSLFIVQKIGVSEEFDFEDSSDSSASSIKTVSFRWEKEKKLIASFKYDSKILQKASRDFRYNGMIALIHQRPLDILYTSKFNEIVAKDLGQERFLMQLETIRTTLLSANRIYADDKIDDKVVLPILKVSADLKKKLQDQAYHFLSISQSEDGKFVKEILSLGQDNKKVIEEGVYHDKIEELKSCAEKLQSFVITKNKIEIPDFTEDNKQVLSLYIPHLSIKLHCCDDILDKVILFEEMLKEKCFSNKYITISSEYGIRAISSSNGDFLELSDLSSGEQDEIVLLYKMIFEVPNNSILLVDEPETSLHVVWLKMVVADFKKIAEAKKSQFIVATHSPSIVREGRSVATDLFFLNKESGYDGE